MQKPTEVPVKTVSEVLSRLEQIQGKQSKALWYRGIGQTAHKLLPTLYRHKKVSGAENFAALERQLLTRFRQRSLPYHDRDLSDDWDALFFMQHYGAPTRLLDWTENPLTALHFALMGAKVEVAASGKASVSSEAAMWVLDPIAWNRHALRHVSFNGAVLTPSDPAINGHQSTYDFDGMPNLPVALYGTHNSPRIVAQQGVFTVFGRDAVPMERAYAEQGFPKDCLVKFLIPRSAILGMRKSLLHHGVSESVVFPDLEGLARETKRIFEFE